MTRRLWVTLILLGIAAGCGARYVTPQFPATSSLPNGAARDLASAASKITVRPRFLEFYYTGKPITKPVIVLESGYTGRFIEHNRCNFEHIASASPLQGPGPRLKVEITAKKHGECYIGFLDAARNVYRLPIIVVTPTPSPGPTPPVRGLYVTYANNAVIEVASNGTIYCIPATVTPTKCSQAGFGNSTGVALDSAGNVYVANYDANAVDKIARNGKVTCVPSTITLKKCAEKFFYPGGVAVDAAGDVYVAGGGLVQKVTPSGAITTINNPNQPYGPTAVAVDSAGDLYVANFNNGTVEEYATNGTTTTIGSGFRNPGGVAVDASGDVYVADTGNKAVKEVAANGTITCVPSTVTLANCGAAGFSQPVGVAVDRLGNVYVADNALNSVREIAPNGTMTCVPSTLPLAKCRLRRYQNPNGLALDANRDPL